MAHKVFISYATEDKQIADAVCETLEAHGIKCWYAPRDVTYGRDFDETIVDAICDSRLMILILSSHSNSSAHVKREVQNACMEDSTIPVLPFRVEDVALNKALRYYIGAVHWLDAITPPLESHLDNLVHHVEARLPRTAPLPPLTPSESREAFNASLATASENTELKPEAEQVKVAPEPNILRCPLCNRTYSIGHEFCLDDGTRLVILVTHRGKNLGSESPESVQFVSEAPTPRVSDMVPKLTPPDPLVASAGQAPPSEGQLFQPAIKTLIVVDPSKGGTGTVGTRTTHNLQSKGLGESAESRAASAKKDGLQKRNRKGGWFFMLLGGIFASAPLWGSSESAIPDLFSKLVLGFITLLGIVFLLIGGTMLIGGKR